MVPLILCFLLKNQKRLRSYKKRNNNRLLHKYQECHHVDDTKPYKKTYPQTKVIILTMFPEKSYIDQLMSAGADGCLLKSRGSKDLLDAIECVSSSRSYSTLFAISKLQMNILSTT